MAPSPYWEKMYSMTEQINGKGNEPEHPMQSLLDADSGLSMPGRGEIRDGVIARITPSEILVDVGAKSEGVITGRALYDGRLDLAAAIAMAEKA